MSREAVTSWLTCENLNNFPVAKEFAMTLCPGHYGISVATQGYRVGDLEGRLLSFCITAQSAANDKDVDGSGHGRITNHHLAVHWKDGKKHFRPRQMEPRWCSIKVRLWDGADTLGPKPALILSVCILLYTYSLLFLNLILIKEIFWLLYMINFN